MRRFVLSVACLLVLFGMRAYGQQPLQAQEPQWSVAVAAVGSDKITIGQSELLLGKVTGYFETYKMVTVRGQFQSGLRSEITNDAVLRRAGESAAAGAVVLQFQPARKGASAGYAYLWVSTIAGPPRRHVQYIANVAGEVFEEAKQIFAYIVRAMSVDKYYLVELHVFARPRGSFFTVGNSKPDQADLDGRQPDEGFKLWSGIRPAGVTQVRVYRLPEYRDYIQQIRLPASDSEPFRIIVEAQLMRSP